MLFFAFKLDVINFEKVFANYVVTNL